MMRVLSSAALVCTCVVSTVFAQHIDGIAAIVGDSVILESEVSAQVMMKAQQTGVKPDPLTENLMRKEALEELVDGKVLLVRAEKDTQITVGNEEVEAETNGRIEYIRTSNKLTLEQLDTVLQREQGMSLSRFRKEVRAQVRQDLLRQRMIQQYVSTAPMSRSEVEAFYAQYRDSLPSAGQSVLLQMIRLDNTAGDTAREHAWARIQNAKTRLDAGDDFSAVAKDISDDPSGGDLGFVAKGSLGEIRFEEQIFALKPGKYSSPFESRLGFHIVKSEERREQMVHARQIFVSVAPPEAGFTVLAIRLDSVRSAAADSASFARAAKGMSRDDVTASVGGLMRWQTVQELPAEIRSAFDALSVGLISKPVRSDRSVSLYRIAAMVDNRVLTLADDFSEIAKIAQRVEAQKRLSAKVARWRTETFVDIRE